MAGNEQISVERAMSVIRRIASGRVTSRPPPSRLRAIELRARDVLD